MSKKINIGEKLNKCWLAIAVFFIILSQGLFSELISWRFSFPTVVGLIMDGFWGVMALLASLKLVKIYIKKSAIIKLPHKTVETNDHTSEVTTNNDKKKREKKS